MKAKNYQSAWAGMIDFITRNTKQITEWECAFVASVSNILQKGNELTLRQSFTLRKIYNKVSEKLG